jgi:hypothetical protein
MPELLPGLSTLELPKMYRVRQSFDEQRIDNIDAAVRDAIANAPLKAGMTVALGVGSRGIAHIDDIVRAAVAAIKARDINVFIIPCMGSHGGATAEGQQSVLAKLGITEANVGAPVRSSMDAVEIGAVQSAHGNEVKLYMDAIAHREADAVIPINRVKPHTGFKGDIESGICKMLTIGLGKHVGCARLHREGMTVFDHLIPAAGQTVLDTGRVPCALAIVENAYEHHCIIEAIPADRVLKREAELLDIAKQRMARLLPQNIDVLVIEEVGKNISGVGMDANVTGRGELGPMPGPNMPKINRIVVLGLSKDTYGNAHGIGNADIITQKLFDGIDTRATWTNTLTAGSLGAGQLPVAMPDERSAIMAAASCVFGTPAKRATIVRIHNTLCLTEIAVSESALEMIEQTDGCEVVGEWDGTWSS